MSSLSGSQNFFKEWRSIESIKTFLNENGNEKYYLEYPNFSEIQNFFILSHLQKFIKFDLEKTLEYPISEYGINAYFSLWENENLWSITYTINALSFSGSNFYSTEKTFFVTTDGNIVEPRSFIQPQDNNTMLSLGKILQNNYQKQFSKEWENLSENISQKFSSYLENPEFSFSWSFVSFSIPPKIFSENQANTIKLDIPYSEVQNFIKKTITPTVIKHTKPSNTPRDKKYVALTFDDGPHKTLTPKLLNILKEKWVKATFFVLGQNVERLPEVTKEIHKEGHEIGSHSWDHASFLKLSNQSIKNQIQKTQTAVKNATWIEPTLFRPPYGAYNKNTIKNVWLTFVLWSVDSWDWKNKNVAKNLKTVLSTTHDGAIILFHDIHWTSVDTIPQLIDSLREKWYEFLTVSELYSKYYNRTLLPEQVCFSMDRCGAK